ncbi:MAG TPA: fluoride efflux transporter CrcB [Actinomycetota bacterium]|nr:fluoride efflux transporter CrcB [Actinomycetota bacterium]
MTWVWIAAAGAAGSVCRWAVQSLVMGNRLPVFPFATAAVNLSGCFLIGLLFAVFQRRWSGVPAEVQLAVLVGLLGGYTTFSTFSFETLRLVEGGGLALAAVNVLLSVAGGLAATWAGLQIGRAV